MSGSYILLVNYQFVKAAACFSLSDVLQIKSIAMFIRRSVASLFLGI